MTKKERMDNRASAVEALRANKTLPLFEETLQLAREVERSALGVGADKGAFNQMAVKGLLLHSIDCAQALAGLVNPLLPGPANVLARTIFEAGITSLYIQRDPEGLAPRFLAYDAVVRHRLVEEARKHPEWPWSKRQLKQKARIQECDVAYKMAVQNIPDLDKVVGRQGKVEKTKSWAGNKTLADMTGELGIDYIGYRFMCGWTHAGAEIVGAYFHDLKPVACQASILHPLYYGGSYLQQQASIHSQTP